MIYAKIFEKILSGGLEVSFSICCKGETVTMVGKTRDLTPC